MIQDGNTNVSSTFLHQLLRLEQFFNVKFFSRSGQKSFVLVGPGPPSADRRGYNAACYYITEPRTEPSSDEKLPNSAEPNRTRT